MLAAWTDKPFRPSCATQRTGTRRFGAVLIEEADQRQAGLELDTIHSHERDSCDRGFTLAHTRRIGRDSSLTSALIRYRQAKNRSHSNRACGD